MQSAGRRVPVPLAPGDLDLPIRSVLPELARGAAAFGRLGITTPRQALFYLPSATTTSATCDRSASWSPMRSNPRG